MTYTLHFDCSLAHEDRAEWTNGLQASRRAIAIFNPRFRDQSVHTAAQNTSRGTKALNSFSLACFFKFVIRDFNSQTERVNNKRQFGGLEDVGKIVDALGQFDLREVSGFLSELPELFESIETIVDGVDEYL